MADTPKPPLPPWVQTTALPPQESYAWFLGKMLFPAFDWKTIWNEEHAAALTVAGMLKLDLLKTVYEKLGEAIAEGKDAKWFEKQLTPILKKAGWWGEQDVTNPVTGEVVTKQLGSPTRLQLIYNVNLRNAEAAGRWQQAERVKATQGFMLRRTMDDDRVRKIHAQWKWLALPIDDPWWDEHAAPCDYGCRCKDLPISEDGIQDYIDAGYPIQRKAPETLYKTFERNGETIKVPAGVGPGFGYNPGKPGARKKGLDSIAKSKRDNLPPSLKKGK